MRMQTLGLFLLILLIPSIIINIIMTARKGFASPPVPAASIPLYLGPVIFCWIGLKGLISDAGTVSGTKALADIMIFAAGFILLQLVFNVTRNQ